MLPPTHEHEPTSHTGNASTERSNPSAGSWIAKLLILVAIVGAFLMISRSYGDQLTFENFAQREASLRTYQQSNTLIVCGGAILLYVAVSGLSIPGGAVSLSLVYGSYFGWLPAVALVSVASTAGATLAFLTSRYLFREVVQHRFHNQLITFNRKLVEEGAFYLFSLRLIFAVPFFMLNLVMGLTKMKWTTYWWVSQLGMLPGTMAYVYAGSTVKLRDLADHGFQGVGWQTLFALAILGTLPIVLKKVMGCVRLRKQKLARSPEVSGAP